jgi:single-stranded DNA-binding protein
VVDKYKSILKNGQVVQVEGSLKNYRWQESDGMKKKRIIILVGRYDSNLAILPIKKEADMPYLNKVFILGSCYKANIRSTQDGRLMGIFPILTKKTYKDRNTGNIVDQDEWLDTFVFNEMMLKSFPLGEVPMENKLIFF